MAKTEKYGHCAKKHTDHAGDFSDCWVRVGREEVFGDCKLLAGSDGSY